jgi:predicted Zn-dependent protease
MGMIHAVFILILSCTVFAQSALDLEADLQKHPDHLSARMQLGNIYLQQKNYDKVITLLNSYTDQLTDQGFLALSSAYSNRKDYVDEVRTLTLLVQKEPDDYHWHMLLGQAYLKQVSIQGDLAKKKDLATEGIKQFRQSLKLQPKYKPAFNILLTTLLQQKANNEARELIEEGINVYGHRPELYSELCRLDAGDGFLDSALKNCREAIQLAPNYPDSYVFLVQALYDQKEELSAENSIVTAGRKFPQSEFVQWAAGTLFFRKKNYPVATRYFAAAVKADPKSSRGHFGLAQGLFESGQEKDSLEHFIFACKTDVTTVDTFLAAGGRLKQKGNMALGDKFVSTAYTCKSSP